MILLWRIVIGYDTPTFGELIFIIVSIALFAVLLLLFALTSIIVFRNKPKIKLISTDSIYKYNDILKQPSNSYYSNFESVPINNKPSILTKLMSLLMLFVLILPIFCGWFLHLCNNYDFIWSLNDYYFYSVMN